MRGYLILFQAIMTISDAILVATAIDLGISVNQLNKAAVDANLTAGDTYTKANENAVNAAAAKLLEPYLLINNQSQGGFSVSINTDEVRNRLNYLAANSGGLYVLPDNLKNQRTVKARNVW